MSQNFSWAVIKSTHSCFFFLIKVINWWQKGSISWVAKTTTKSSDVLGFRELSIELCLLLWLLTAKGCKTKLGKWKGTWGEVQRKPGISFWNPILVGCWQFLQQQTVAMLPIRKAPLLSSYQDFWLSEVTQAFNTSHSIFTKRSGMVRLSYQEMMRIFQNLSSYIPAKDRSCKQAFQRTAVSGRLPLLSSAEVTVVVSFHFISSPSFFPSFFSSFSSQTFKTPVTHFSFSQRVVRSKLSSHTSWLAYCLS